MRLEVIEHHASDQVRRFEGDETELRRDLLYAYPFLAVRCGAHTPLRILMASLNRLQAYSVYLLKSEEVAKSDPGAVACHPVALRQLGHRMASDPTSYLAAAAFLAGGGSSPGPEAIRAAEVASNGDPVLAALRAYGLDPTSFNRDLLISLAEMLAKGVLIESTELPKPGDIMAATADAEGFAGKVRRATLHRVELGGKHSSGSMVAAGPHDDPYYLLLKPGAGNQNPASGDNYSGSSQAKREACFYACASKSFDLANHVPECHLLLLDGREYAAIKMLPLDYRTMNEIRQADRNFPARFYALYRDQVHWWATMDYVLGQVDRNAGNEMARGDDVQLIDGGSAFAGDDFDPARDRSTFVPHYLRAGCPDDFDARSPDEKFHLLPRVAREVAQRLGQKIVGIDARLLEDEQVRFGIDPGPSLRRLDKLRTSVATMPADLAVNAAWTL